MEEDIAVLAEDHESGDEDTTKQTQLTPTVGDGRHLTGSAGGLPKRSPGSEFGWRHGQFGSSPRAWKGWRHCGPQTPRISRFTGVFCALGTPKASLMLPVAP